MGDRGGCATGLYRTPTTLGHTTKTGTHSSSTQYIETNTGGCQNEETKKYGPNERTDKNSRKKLNEMEIRNLSDAEFKTLVIRMVNRNRFIDGEQMTASWAGGG